MHAYMHTCVFPAIDRLLVVKCIENAPTGFRVGSSKGAVSPLWNDTADDPLLAHGYYWRIAQLHCCCW